MNDLARVGIAALALLGTAVADARPRPVPGASPTNGQEVSPDLSDPELDGVIRVRYRLPARALRLLPDELVEGPLLTLRDHERTDVPFAWEYDAVNRILEVRPGLPMVPAQYTLDMDARLLGRRQKSLGRGRGFSTSFSVGWDMYAPLLLVSRPGTGHLDVPRTAPVVATFSESLDPASVILGETVFVENHSVQPPVPVPGTLFLDRQGFDLVFRAAGALPRASIVGVRLLGLGNPVYVRDAVGNGLAGDPQDGDQLRFHFSTGLR